MRRSIPIPASRGLACPHDGTRLVTEMRDGLLVDLCPACGGLWFDRDELEDATNDPNLEAWAEAAVREGPPAGVRCPKCGATCIRSGVGTIVLDTCTACHGIWIEPGRPGATEFELVRTARST